MKKKALFGMSAPLVLFWTFLGYLLFLVIFAGLFFIKSCQDDTDSLQDVKSASAGSDSQMVLLNYLRTQTIVAGSRMSFADLIRLTVAGQSSETDFVTKSIPVFTRFYDGCVFVCIDDEIFPFNNCQDFYTTCGGPSILIPNFDGSFIKVVLDSDPMIVVGGPGAR